MFLLSRFLFGSFARYAQIPLWDFEVLHSCLLAMPDGFKIGMDHRLERGPAIERGHDASNHGRAGNTASMATLDETIF